VAEKQGRRRIGWPEEDRLKAVLTLATFEREHTSLKLGLPLLIVIGPFNLPELI